MVAQVNREAFSNILHTPALDPADSQDIALALETARSLEAAGDLEEATRWIRRAVDHAEREGHDARVLVLARAAADLTQTVAGRAKASMPPMLAALVASLPPFSARTSSSAPPPSVAPARSSSPAAPPAERTMRMGAIRVAIRGSIHETKSLEVERLDKDEPAPAGSIEAMLVLTGPIEGSLEIVTNLPVGDRATRRH